MARVVSRSNETEERMESDRGRNIAQEGADMSTRVYSDTDMVGPSAVARGMRIMR